MFCIRSQVKSDPNNIIFCSNYALVSHSLYGKTRTKLSIAKIWSDVYNPDFDSWAIKKAPDPLRYKGMRSFFSGLKTA